MPLELVGLLLLAALCHAAWHAFVKASQDRLAGLVAINSVSMTAGLVMLPLVPLPGHTGWLILSASVGVHVAYKVLLSVAYERGDLGQVYPAVRGVSPLLVGATAVVALGERMSASEAAGMAVICFGLLLLAVERGELGSASFRSLRPALLAGFAVSLYTVIDGLGAREAPSPFAFAAWLFVLDGAAFILTARLWRGAVLWRDVRSLGRSGLASGLVAMGSYGAFIWALSLGAMGAIAALRETSVLFSVLVGAVFLGERLGPFRVAAAVLITAGIVLIAL